MLLEISILLLSILFGGIIIFFTVFLLPESWILWLYRKNKPIKKIKAKDTSEIPDNFTGIVERDDGVKFWYKNGKCHKLGSPAIVWENGSKFWYQHGKQHRLDGPAVEYSNGSKFWFINGNLYTEEKFKQKTWFIQLLIESGKYDKIKKKMKSEHFYKYLNLLVK